MFGERGLKMRMFESVADVRCEFGIKRERINYDRY